MSNDKFYTIQSKSMYSTNYETVEEAKKKASGRALRDGDSMYIMESILKVDAPEVADATVTEIK